MARFPQVYRWGSAKRKPDGWWNLLPFTTHKIQIADGLWTVHTGVIAEADVRSHFVLEALGGSLAGKSVVDLGCLEGGFSVAFARLGAERVLGIEAREISYRRCELVRQLLGFQNLRFVHGDFKDVLAATAPFDVVLACGVLYHVSDPVALIDQIFASCTQLALIDTHVANSDNPFPGCEPEIVTHTFRGKQYQGMVFTEFHSSRFVAEREQALWAAWSDQKSFWPTEEALVEMLREAGFSRVEKLDPSSREEPFFVAPLNRVVYMCYRSSSRSCCA